MLLGLNIKRPPDRLEYKVGELFDPTEMVVEALYSGDNAKEIQADWMPKEPLKLSDKFIMICFQDKAVMLPISVKDVDAVEVKTKEKSEAEGEPFPQKRTEKQMKKRNKNKIKKSKVD